MARNGASEKSEQGGAEQAKPVTGKGRPTPSRKEAQAANARPIVGAKDKAALKEQRRQQAEARERARLGMMQGDERYLTVRDRGPQRRFVREYVDARWSVGEMLIPMMVLVLISTFIPGVVQIAGLAIIWIFVGLAVLDAVLLGFRLKKLLAAKFGEDKVQPGYRWYAAMRAFQFRPLRVPKPQNKRGAFPS